MISHQMSRSELCECIGCEKAALREEIKRLKAAGRLVELRPYVQPHIDKKRAIRFVFVATTNDLFATETAA